MKKEYSTPIVLLKVVAEDIVTASSGEDSQGMFDKNIFSLDDIF